jgi:ADP-ribose pyrophosphatase
MSRKPRLLKSECVFAGRKVVLEIRTYRGRDGREAVREVVRHRGSVAILAFPRPGRVLLERAWRHAVGREMLEIPAGTLEPGEDPAACAARELAEETGYRATHLEPLLAIHPSPGVLSERLTVYVATGLRRGRTAREAGEEIRNVLVPVEKVLRMIREGRVTDAKTVAALLYWDRFRKADA